MTSTAPLASKNKKTACILSDFPGIRNLSSLNDLNSLNNLSGLNDLNSLISLPFLWLRSEFLMT